MGESNNAFIIIPGGQVGKRGICRCCPALPCPLASQPGETSILPPNFPLGRGGLLTQCHQCLVALLHHVAIQSSLSRVQHHVGLRGQALGTQKRGSGTENLMDNYCLISQWQGQAGSRCGTGGEQTCPSFCPTILQEIPTFCPYCFRNFSFFQKLTGRKKQKGKTETQRFLKKQKIKE